MEVGVAGWPSWLPRYREMAEVITARRVARRVAADAAEGWMPDLIVERHALFSDAGWRAKAFDTFWKELDELVICGLSPIEAIHAATGAVTAALGLDGEFGTLRPGQRADLVVVDGNPADRTQALRDVVLVVQAGDVVNAAM